MKRSLLVVAAIGLVADAKSILSQLETVATDLGLDSEAEQYRAQLEELMPAAH